MNRNLARTRAAFLAQSILIIICNVLLDVPFQRDNGILIWKVTKQSVLIQEPLARSGAGQEPGVGMLLIKLFDV
eukprot:11731237-Karenia_brevis.AAC.1